MPGKITKNITSAHEGDITGIAYCPKNGFIYTCGGDLKVKVWDKDLNLQNQLVAGESWLYAISVTDSGKVYVGSNDGTLRVIGDATKEKASKKILECQEEIIAVYCDKERAYCGDNTGVVSFFEDDKFISRIETSETVMSLRVEGNMIYSVRDKDLSINTLNTSKMLANVTSRAVIPGRAPIELFGPVVDGHHSYIVLPFRAGKGFAVHLNKIKGEFKMVAQTEENAHELMIFAIAATGNFVFTGDYAGKVKRWELNEDQHKLDLSDEVDVCPGICVNGLLVTDESTLYVAGSDGNLRKIEYF